MPSSKVRLAAGIAAGISIAVFGSAALLAAPSDTITARQTNFKAMGQAMKGIVDEMKTPAPNMAVIRTNSDALARAAPHVVGGFPRGTGPEAGVKAQALPIIWTRLPEFHRDAAAMVTATRGLQAAARSGDIARVRVAFGATGGSCKACHDVFRLKE